MRSSRIRGDLALLREGVEVAVGFGVRSLEGLVDVAELLEHSVYEPRSLRSTGDGFCFTLLNPPLRMGAFSSVRLLWNGSEVDPTRAALAVGRSAARPLGSIAAASPVTLPIGERVRFSVHAAPVEPGRHRVRLELQSVAVPPLVWLEFADEMGAPEAGPA